MYSSLKTQSITKRVYKVRVGPRNYIVMVDGRIFQDRYGRERLSLSQANELVMARRATIKKRMARQRMSMLMRKGSVVRYSKYVRSKK